MLLRTTALKSSSLLEKYKNSVPLDTPAPTLIMWRITWCSSWTPLPPCMSRAMRAMRGPQPFGLTQLSY